MPPLHGPSDQDFSLVGRLARLGCTRIGSPGIFGERNPKALFRAMKPQVAHERKRASLSGEFSRLEFAQGRLLVPPRPPVTVVALAAA